MAIVCVFLKYVLYFSNFHFCIFIFLCVLVVGGKPTLKKQKCSKREGRPVVSPPHKGTKKKKKKCYLLSHALMYLKLIKAVRG